MDMFSGVEEQTQPEREFSRTHGLYIILSLFYFPKPLTISLFSFSRILAHSLPSPLMADGLPLARSIKLCGSGTLAIQQRDVSSTIAKHILD
jgi:hypothetical protein